MSADVSYNQPPRTAVNTILRDWRFWLVLVLAIQFPVLQLMLGVQYGDASRNLHWSILASENPSFLFNGPDIYNRVNGFVPDPSALAPAGMASNEQPRGLHPWWGPVYVLLIGGVWQLTGSFTAIQLIVPIAATGVVLLSYLVGRSLVGANAAVIGTVLLALQPTFREHAVVSYVEALSALILAGALIAFVQRRTWIAVVLGCVAMYGKIDLIFIYLGTVAIVGFWHRTDFGARHVLMCFAIPLLAILPWVIVVYGVIGRPVRVANGGISWQQFVVLVPKTLEQLYLLGWWIAVIIGSIIGWLIWRGSRRTAANPEVIHTLATWIILGVIVFAVYMATPGASNNPRILMPAFLPAFLLVGVGLMSIGPRLRLILLQSMVMVSLVGTVTITLYQRVYGQLLQDIQPALTELRTASPGTVLTNQYWPAILFARQPATAFEHDPTFQRNILWNVEHFQRYLAANPIRYVLMPSDPNYHQRLLQHPAAQLASVLPGREFDIEPTDWVAPDVRTYLDTRFLSQTVGSYTLYTVR